MENIDVINRLGKIEGKIDLLIMVQTSLSKRLEESEKVVLALRLKKSFFNGQASVYGLLGGSVVALLFKLFDKNILK